MVRSSSRIGQKGQPTLLVPGIAGWRGSWLLAWPSWGARVLGVIFPWKCIGEEGREGVNDDEGSCWRHMPSRPAYLGDEVRQRIEHIVSHHVKERKRSIFILGLNGGADDTAHPFKRDMVGEVCVGKPLQWVPGVGRERNGPTQTTSPPSRRQWAASWMLQRHVSLRLKS